MDGAISQLHSIRNGYRSNNAISRQNHKSNWAGMQQWQQQHQAPQAHYIIQQQQPQQKTGSESGSSGDISPPPSSIDSAGMHGNANQSQSSGLRAQAVNLSRLNGAQQGVAKEALHASSSSNSLEFNGSPVSANSGTTLVTSNSSGNLLLVGGPLHNFPTYRNLPQTRQFPGQVNGEINIYPAPFNQPFIAPTQNQPQQQRVSPSPSLLPTAYPLNKLVQSCFNCGSTSHTGLNCSEASMEDVTRNAVYKLDYTVSTQTPSPFTPVSVMTSSSSSGNLNAANNNVNSSSSETQLEPSIYIDLTQDTSSDSSVSNR